MQDQSFGKETMTKQFYPDSISKCLTIKDLVNIQGENLTSKLLTRLNQKCSINYKSYFCMSH